MTHSHPQKLSPKKLKSLIRENIPKIIEDLGITGYNLSDKLVASCPVHEGDNENAFNINLDEDSDYYGTWFCNTKCCHEEYGNDIFGLIKGVKDCNFPKALNFARKYISNSSFSRKTTDLVDKFLADKKTESIISRQDVISKLDIPATLYAKTKHFNIETLKKFDIGFAKDGYLKGRVIFPVYDEKEMFVGCTARSMSGAKPKWTNSKGFKKGECLYNFYNALPFIQKKQEVIVVEGQGDVLRMYEAGFYNTVGMFGCFLTETQQRLLIKSGAMSILILLDSDPAGLTGKEKIKQNCGGIFNLRDITLPKKDVGEMTNEEVRSVLNR